MRLQSSNIDVYICTIHAYKNPPTAVIPLTAEVRKKGNNLHVTIIVYSERRNNKDWKHIPGDIILRLSQYTLYIITTLFFKFWENNGIRIDLINDEN